MGLPRGHLPGVRTRPCFLSASTTGQLGALSWWWASQDSLPGQVAPASGLEADDDAVVIFSSTPPPDGLKHGSPKKTLRWPMRYRLLSVSRALI